MKLDSKYFDRIRVKPEQDRLRRDETPVCDWPGCAAPAGHRAPKGREAEGEYFQFCVQHVRDYNKSYNYFAGMNDDELSAWQKQAHTGHRPTWRLGQNSWALNNGGRHRRSGGYRINADVNDPFDMLGDGHPNRFTDTTRPRAVRNAELKALHELGLDESAQPDEIKAQYKKLVKRLHPDANSGSRDNEDKLREIIRAYDYLRTAGIC